jgi:hypothetical protein
MLSNSLVAWKDSSWCRCKIARWLDRGGAIWLTGCGGSIGSEAKRVVSVGSGSSLLHSQ